MAQQPPPGGGTLFRPSDDFKRRPAPPNLITMAPQAFPDAVTPITVKFPVNGVTSALIANESPYATQVNAGASSKWIPAWTADIIPVDASALGQLVITPTLITIAVAPPSAYILVTLAIGEDVIPGTWPAPLSRQVSSYQAPSLLDQHLTGAAYNAVTPYQKDFQNLPAATTGIALALTANGNVNVTVTVVGDQSGASYPTGIAGWSQAQLQANPFIVVPINSQADSGVTVTISTTTSSGKVTGIYAVTGDQMWVTPTAGSVLSIQAVSGAAFDVSDRTARQLGLVDAARRPNDMSVLGGGVPSVAGAWTDLGTLINVTATSRLFGWDAGVVRAAAAVGRSGYRLRGGSSNKLFYLGVKYGAATGTIPFTMPLTPPLLLTDFFTNGEAAHLDFFDDAAGSLGELVAYVAD